ncbi:MULTISPECIES: YtxH domain-containing protein [Arthrobacter]|uniref:YtxH domain-containing protein n=1 Tax=unclassified Arthrobacter TaxID=235627 RepID=UPI0024B8E319|nr:YtxH domain-containing protein [Arthrobacter sp. H35-MC1]MDJ0315581.1 YtxH domain-containing protein [Arthrobacter sp. H35-MC1]
MKAKLTFLAGLAVGYVVGTRVGRRGYESLKKNAKSVWETDIVQETVTTVEDTVKDQAKDLGARLVGKVAGTESGRRVAREKDSSEVEQPALSDVDSDPALNNDVGQDWADEGGALPSGPAR